MTSRWIVLFPVAALLLCACVSDRGKELAPTNTQMLFDSWTLRTLDGNAIESLVPQGARVPSLSIDLEGKVSGYTGVNSLGSQLDMEAARAGQFKLGGVMTTRRAGPPVLMAVESQYTEALRTATAYNVDESTLTLLSKDEPLLVFARNEKKGETSGDAGSDQASTKPSDKKK